MTTDKKCIWVTSGGRRCSNVILMDGHCSRHLKQQCSICLESVRSTNSANTKRLTCGHSFHHKCITEWFIQSNICPKCRKEQSHDPLIKFKNDVEDKLRNKYKDAMDTYEKEIKRLKENIRRYSAYHDLLNNSANL